MEVRRVITAAMSGQRKRPLIKDSSGGYIPASFSGGRGASSLPSEETKNDVVQLTCGNCQIICAGDPKETAENYKILVNSGCVIQREDGTLEVFPPDKAKEEFEKMPLKRQRWYTKDYKKKMRRTSGQTAMMP
jgi:hypothetical protein